MGTAMWFGASQANKLLHELSHLAASTDDLNWSWLPGPLPGNPTNIAFTDKFMPTLAADDAWFVQTLQEHTVASVNESWILPYLYEK